jgi:ComF family protein
MPGFLPELIKKSRFLLDDLFAFISSPLCSGCGRNLEYNHLPLCDICRLRLVNDFHGEGPVCLICHAPQAIACGCLIDNRYPMPSMFYWCDYTETVKSLIHGFKFQGDIRLGSFLIDMALNVMSERLSKIACETIVPIPLRPKDKRHRGFNQSDLIAEKIGSIINAPVDLNLLHKIKPTRLQANLSAKERWLNVKDVFAVKDIDSVRGKSILLVDDIVTTGATSREASRALCSAGALKVTVFALACADIRKQAG